MAADTAFDPLAVFKNTLIGKVIEIFRAQGVALRTEEVVTLVENVGELRKLDGGKYKGSVARSVLGCLQQNQIFRFEGGMWVMDDAAAQDYIEGRIAIISARRRRIESSKSTPKPKNIASSRHRRLIAFLEKQVGVAKSDDSFNSLWATPAFSRLKETDDPQMVVDRLGIERAMGIAQAYQLVKKQYRAIFSATSDKSLEASLEKTVSTILQSTARIKKLIQDSDTRKI